MKLTRIEVRNFRSLYVDGDHAFNLDLSEGMNALIGPNNCGKSNVLRAVALALDPGYQFDRRMDAPTAKPMALPRITLQFQCEPGGDDEALLRLVRNHERAVQQDLAPKGLRSSSTFADDGIVRFIAEYVSHGQGAPGRLESFETRGGRSRLFSEEGNHHRAALDHFRRSYQFVMIESGESLESVLTRKLREILYAVVQDHLLSKFQAAERRRDSYIKGLQDDLLEPLRGQVEQIVGTLFPEITGVELVPDVSSIDETLSNVAFRLTDAAVTDLAAKGTGVRGGVMVAMLRYLTDRTERSMVVAVEEPETFLHPAAQEDLRDDLEKLAERPAVSLLVTTHSPFVVSRNAKAQVVGLTKDPKGRTIKVGQARGAESSASLIGGLFRDAALADLLERTAEIPPGTRGIVIVEGPTDKEYMEVAVEVADRKELLAGLHVVPAGGATKAVALAILMKHQTVLPKVVLLDSDKYGDAARKDLRHRFNFPAREVASYADVFKNHDDVEAEHLFDPELVQAFVNQHGENTVLERKHYSKADDEWRHDLTSLGKQLLTPFVGEHATAEHVIRWIQLLELLRSNTKLRLG